MPYTVRLQKFEGPLELLLFLIRKNEIDIYDIPIAHITNQYLEYLDIMRILDLEVAGEFILVAATLMRIKAQMLLPSPELDEDYEDPRAEIVQRLLEYQKYKELANSLAVLEEKQRDFYPRSFYPLDGDGFHDEEAVSGQVTLFDLVAAMGEVLERTRHEAYHNVEEAETSVEEQMSFVLDQMAQKDEMLFVDLISGFRNRILLIATFLAILELVRRGVIVVRQSSPFGEIWIYGA